MSSTSSSLSLSTLSSVSSGPSAAGVSATRILPRSLRVRRRRNMPDIPRACALCSFVCVCIPCLPSFRVLRPFLDFPLTVYAEGRHGMNIRCAVNTCCVRFTGTQTSVSVYFSSPSGRQRYFSMFTCPSTNSTPSAESS